MLHIAALCHIAVDISHIAAICHIAVDMSHIAAICHIAVDMSHIAAICHIAVDICCCCCSAYLSSCHRTASGANLLDDPHSFHYNDYFVIGGIRTCLGVSDDPMFLWLSSNSCPLNLLLVRSHQAEIIIVKRLIQGRNNMTRVRVEPRPFDQGRRKNDALTHSATLPTKNDALTQRCHILLQYVICLIAVDKSHIVAICHIAVDMSNRDKICP